MRHVHNVTKCAKPPIHCRNKAHTFLLVLDGNSFMSTQVIFQEVIWHAIEHNFQQTSEQIILLKDRALCGSRLKYYNNYQLTLPARLLHLLQQLFK